MSMKVQREQFHKKKSMVRAVTVLLVAFYLFLSVTQMMLNRYQVVFTVLDGELTATSVNGVLSVMQMLVVLILVLLFQRKGVVLSVFLLGTQVLSLGLMMIATHRMDALPGMAMAVESVLVVLILHSHLKYTEKSEERLRKQANTDEMTGLPNRRVLYRKIKEEIQKGEEFAVVFMDLDRFKNINDVLGHQAGDDVLRMVAQRWQELLKENHTLLRLGGDEFALIMPQPGSVETVKEYLEQFLKAVREHFVLEDKKLYVSASFGVSVYPQDGADATALLQCADTAMYQAKNGSDEKVIFYHCFMMEAAKRDLETSNMIYNSLLLNQFTLEFQPQYDTRTRKLRGFETLIRMVDEKGNKVKPSLFIPIAEKSGAIFEVDCWVMRNAMIQFKEVVKEKPDIILAINISAVHLLDNRFMKDLKQTLAWSEFPAKNLEIEITESVFISSMEDAVEKLNEMREMGIQIALDDFGTGYTSLSYLKSLPVSLLKIDKSFVDALLAGDKNNEKFVEMIISLGHILGIKVIAEGVEEDRQLHCLQRLGCDEIQGFIWGRPLEYSSARKLSLGATSA